MKADKERGDYRVSRMLYCVEAALEYFVAIMVGETYLAKIAGELGASDALTGVLYAFVSLGSAFQIFSILLSDKTPVKRWVTPLHILNQIFFYNDVCCTIGLFFQRDQNSFICRAFANGTDIDECSQSSKD